MSDKCIETRRIVHACGVGGSRVFTYETNKGTFEGVCMRRRRRVVVKENGHTVVKNVYRTCTFKISPTSDRLTEQALAARRKSAKIACSNTKKTREETKRVARVVRPTSTITIFTAGVFTAGVLRETLNKEIHKYIQQMNI